MPLGGDLVALSTPLHVLPMPVAFLVLRFDMVVLLTKTFEVWCMTLTNIFVCACIGVSFGDARWLVVVATSVGFGLALWIVVNFRRTRAIAVGTALGARLSIGYAVGTPCGYVHTPQEITLLAFNDRNDAILNVLSTIATL